MNNQLIKSLTQDAIANLEQQPPHAQRGKIVLQFIKARAEKGIILATLSDGEFFEEFVLTKALRTNFNLKANDVIQCVAVAHQRENIKILVLLEFTLIYEGLPESAVIGDPRRYSEIDPLTYIKSKAASTMIPRSVWSQSTAAEEIVTAPANSLQFQRPDFFTPIAQLSPSSMSWAIKARVSFKSGVINYPSGRLFKCIIFDDSDIIELVFYNEFCDKYFPVLEERKVYIVTGADIRPTSKYNTTARSIELHFKNRADLCEYLPSANSVPMHPPLLGSLYRLREASTTGLVSVMAVVVSVGPPVDYVSSSGRTSRRQNLWIVDQDKTKVEVCIWGNFQGLEKIKEHKIFVFENFKKMVSHYGVHLNSTQLARIHDDGFEISSKLTDLFKLAELTKSECLIENVNLSKNVQELHFSDLKQMQEDGQKLIQEPSLKLIYHTTAYVSDFGKFLYYDCCPSDKCRRKVRPSLVGDGVYECPRCGLLPDAKVPSPIYFGQVSIADHTDSIYVTFASEVAGQTIFGVPVAQLKTLTLIEEKDADGNLPLNSFLETRKNIQYKISLTAKLNFYEGETSVRYYITSISPITNVSVLHQVNSSLLNRTKSLSCDLEALIGKRSAESLPEDANEMQGLASQKLIKGAGH